MSAEQGRTSGEHAAECINTLARCTTDAQYCITHRAIDIAPVLEHGLFRFAEQIRFIDGDDGRNMICFTGDEKTIDKTHGCTRISERSHQQ